VTEYPIVFTGDSIPKIRVGTKVQSRRVLRLNEHEARLFDRFDWTVQVGKDGYGGLVHEDARGTTTIPITSPFGAVGGTLWVRETFAEREDINGADPEQRGRSRHYMMFKADGHDPRDPGNFHVWTRWKSPRFMPRWASRMSLELTDLRVQRVRSISEADAYAEGIEPWTDAAQTFNPVVRFGELWDTLNGRRRVRVPRPWPRVNQFTSEVDTSASWASNPVVLALTFRLLDQGPPA
jgi:hypothetical protein